MESVPKFLKTMVKSRAIRPPAHCFESPIRKVYSHMESEEDAAYQAPSTLSNDNAADGYFQQMVNLVLLCLQPPLPFDMNLIFAILQVNTISNVKISLRYSRLFKKTPVSSSHLITYGFCAKKQHRSAATSLESVTSYTCSACFSNDI